MSDADYISKDRASRGDNCPAPLGQEKSDKLSQSCHTLQYQKGLVQGRMDSHKDRIVLSFALFTNQAFKVDPGAQLDPRIIKIQTPGSRGKQQ